MLKHKQIIKKEMSTQKNKLRYKPIYSNIGKTNQAVSSSTSSSTSRQGPLEMMQNTQFTTLENLQMSSPNLPPSPPILSAKEQIEQNWPPLIPGTPTIGRDGYFGEIYKRMIKGHNEATLTETDKGYFYTKAALKFYDEELKQISDTEQRNILIKELKSRNPPNIVEPTGSFFKNKNIIEQKRSMIQTMIDVYLKPRIRREVVPAFASDVEMRVAGKKPTCRVVIEAAMISFEKLLNNPRENFENGCIYGKEELNHFRNHIYELVLHNIDCIPDCIPDSFNLFKAPTVESQPTPIPPVESQEFPTRLKLTHQEKYIQTYQSKLEEKKRNYRINNKMKDTDDVPKSVMKKFKRDVYDEIYKLDPDAVKKSGRVNKKIELDPIIEEFLTQNYKITTTSSTQTTILHNHYKTWLASNYSTQTAKKMATFGKNVKLTKLDGMKIPKFSNGKKNGWRIVPK